MTCSAVGPATRDFITLAEAGSARSSTGAKVVFRPSRVSSSPMSRPCRWANFLSAVKATAAAEGIGAIRSRRRSTRPPSTSMQRKSGVVENALAACSRAWICEGSSIFRRKRITPEGRSSLSHAASVALSTVPSRPTMNREPTSSLRPMLTLPSLARWCRL